MHELRQISENRVMRAVGIALICLILGVGTYLLMSSPDSSMSIRAGSPSSAAPASPEASVAPIQVAPLEISPGAEATPVASPPVPSLPPRAQFSLKVQNAGGSEEAVASILDEAKRLGYRAEPAGVRGKDLSRIVIRHKPGLDAVASRAAEDLAPGAELQAHADISVDLVVAVGKT